MKRLFFAACLFAFLPLVSCTHGPASAVTPPDSTPDTTPVLHDPTVLVRVHVDSPAVFLWQSGTTVFGGDTIPAFGTVCERFTAVADSAYWYLSVVTDHGSAFVKSNYFDPTARPAWTADVNSASAIIQKDTTAEC
jgi:hypothetical protein